MSASVGVLVRISRKHWESAGGVNNPELRVVRAKRGPDRYYIVRARVGGAS